MTDGTSGPNVALPANRAFVMQLAPASGNADPFRGRVEHLTSGRVAHFDSLERLREFVEEVLARASGEPNAGCAETERPRETNR